MELSNSTVKTPEPGTEAPNLTRIQLPLKPHAPPVLTYGKCLKNHAAAIGGYAVDGCGEFMPSPATNPADPTSIRCDACGCHRSFHRRYQPPPHHGGVFSNHNPLSNSGVQAEKMLERVGWKMQMKDEELLNIFL